MREQVEALEDHADLAADVLDALEPGMDGGAVDDDLALLVLFELVQAADQRRFAGAGGTADDDALAARDGEVDVAQDVEVPLELVDLAHLDDHVADLVVGREGGGRGHLSKPFR
ncbi:hypothetical protein OCUBac02_18280 [Bosea sp. ANAM02]|nr:hypothetical protein OCUBac02_18280 [Bosea sp. ANAM02]